MPGNIHFLSVLVARVMQLTMHGCLRAVGAGPAGPATAGPILQANENAQLNFTVTNLQLHYFEFKQEFN